MNERVSNTSNTPAILLHAFVLDCKDAISLAEFYAKLLGGKANHVMEGWVEVTLPGLGIKLSFQREEDYQCPVWPATSPQEQQQMAHLDFIIQDMQEAVDYALSLGATLPSIQYCQPEWDHQWTTLLDPAGHPFCLCKDDLNRP